jgi:hypothetical protein
MHLAQGEMHDFYGLIYGLSKRAEDKTVQGSLPSDLGALKTRPEQ